MGRLVRLRTDKGNFVYIPTAAITEVSYGQEVHHRIGTAVGLAVVSLGIGALVAFSKSKKHFVGLTWDDAGNKGGLAVQADKNEYRGLILALEGVTGKKAVDTDAAGKYNRPSGPSRSSPKFVLKLRRVGVHSQHDGRKQTRLSCPSCKRTACSRSVPQGSGRQRFERDAQSQRAYRSRNAQRQTAR